MLEVDAHVGQIMMCTSSGARKQPLNVPVQRRAQKVGGRDHDSDCDLDCASVWAAWRVTSHGCTFSLEEKSNRNARQRRCQLRQALVADCVVAHLP
eukprot:1712198-Rhodomonas_salina.1